MTEKLDVSVIILTMNEELHLRRCLDNASKIAREIIVVDSYSTDATESIAREYGAKFYQNKWVNYATQFNWALDNTAITSSWILRMDADEYLSEALLEELRAKLSGLSDDISGIVLPLRRVFLGRHIKSCDGVMLLRIFRFGHGYSETRFMDEHIKLSEGGSVNFENWFADDNLNDLSWWTGKHIGYAIREAADLLNTEYRFVASDDAEITGQALKKRKMKQAYARKSLFWRCFVYFIYRYFFKLGFRDGKEGFLWHFLQGWWYRTLVDAKIFEIKKACGGDPEKIKALLREKYNIPL